MRSSMSLLPVVTNCALTLLLTAGAGTCATGSSASALLEGDGRSALLQWLSESSFRFCLTPGAGSCSAHAVSVAEQPTPSRQDTTEAYGFRTKFLAVTVEKRSLRLRVAAASGEVLVDDLRAVEFPGGDIVVERSAGESERFFGLGARPSSPLNIRRTRVKATTPFLLSSSGYGLHHSGPGAYTFGLADVEPGRYRIFIDHSPALDFFFYYGPSPKEILEEHKRAVGAPAMLKTWQAGVIHRKQLPTGAVALADPAEGSWESLHASTRAMVNASMSAIAIPAFDLTPYLAAPTPLFRRATQLGAVSPVVFLENMAVLLEPDKLDAFQLMTERRKQLQSHLLTYATEATTRGLPMLHPLPLQFPKDAEAAKWDDIFMLGDEVLVAPVWSESGRRQVYLPMGFWTDLATNEVHRGRQTIEFEAPEDRIPMFVKNGSILPLDPKTERDPVTLHYIPRLAAEFFLYEPELGEYSQLHAGPVGESMRLEIESLKSRMYEWVVHHVAEAREVTIGEIAVPRVAEAARLRPKSWYYDKKRGDLRVRVEAVKGGDSIVYLHF